MKALYVIGNDHLIPDTVKNEFSREGYRMIGNGRVNPSDVQIQEVIQNVDSQTRINLNYHGAVVNGKHQIAYANTADFFDKITSCAPVGQKLYVHLYSCFAGAAAPDVIHLPKDSVLFTYGTKEYGTYVNTNFNMIENSNLDVNRDIDPILKFFQDLPLSLLQTCTISINNSPPNPPFSFTMRPPLHILKEPNEIRRYFKEQIIEKFKAEAKKANIAIPDLSNINWPDEELVKWGTEYFCYFVRSEPQVLTDLPIAVKANILDKITNKHYLNEIALKLINTGDIALFKANILDKITDQLYLREIAVKLIEAGEKDLVKNRILDKITNQHYLREIAVKLIEAGDKDFVKNMLLDKITVQYTLGQIASKLIEAGDKDSVKNRILDKITDEYTLGEITVKLIEAGDKDFVKNTILDKITFQYSLRVIAVKLIEVGDKDSVKNMLLDKITNESTLGEIAVKLIEVGDEDLLEKVFNKITDECTLGHIASKLIEAGDKDFVKNRILDKITNQYYLKDIAVKLIEAGDKDLVKNRILDKITDQHHLREIAVKLIEAGDKDFVKNTILDKITNQYALEQIASKLIEVGEKDLLKKVLNRITPEYIKSTKQACVNNLCAINKANITLLMLKGEIDFVLAEIAPKKPEVKDFILDYGINLASEELLKQKIIPALFLEQQLQKVALKMVDFKDFASLQKLYKDKDSPDFDLQKIAKKYFLFSKGPEIFASEPAVNFNTWINIGQFSSYMLKTYVYEPLSRIYSYATDRATSPQEFTERVTKIRQLANEVSELEQIKDNFQQLHQNSALMQDKAEDNLRLKKNPNELEKALKDAKIFGKNSPEYQALLNLQKTSLDKVQKAYDNARLINENIFKLKQLAQQHSVQIEAIAKQQLKAGMGIKQMDGMIADLENIKKDMSEMQEMLKQKQKQVSVVKTRDIRKHLQESHQCQQPDKNCSQSIKPRTAIRPTPTQAR